MITAVDTSVLLDVFTADPRFGRASHRALTRALAEGSLVACDIVWAEIAASAPSHDITESNMDRLGVQFRTIDQGAATIAGGAWRQYRAAGGSRRRILADFLIGGHALRHADRLLTRDRGFYRGHFAGLAILDPGAMDV